MLKKPSSWEEITVGQFIEFNLIEKDISYYDRCISLFSIIENSEENVEDITFSEIAIIMESLEWMSIAPANEFKKSINGLTYKPVNKASFGDFIDINFFCDDIYLNIREICSIMYRKTATDVFGNILYDKASLEYVDMFNNIPITDVFGVIQDVVNFKNNITSSYDSHFNQPIVDDDDYEPDEEDLAADKLEEVNNKWAWETLIHKLSNGDITKYECVLNQPIIFIMNHLSHIKSIKL